MITLISSRGFDLNSYLPGGQLPNPKDNQGPKLLYVIWFLIGASTMVLAARLWSKYQKTRRLYYDDILMLIALALGLIHATLATLAVHHGLGRHFIYLSGHPLLYGVVTWGSGNLSPMAGRVAFCVTMLYLTRTDPRVKKWPIWAFIAGQLIFNIAAICFFYAQCGSHLTVLTNSNYELIPVYCLNPHYQTDFNYFVGAFNCLTDAFLTVLPAILIRHARLSLKKKVGLGFLLCLSIVALAAAVVKTYEAKALSQASDYTYDLCDYVIWVSIELNTVITVSSIPLLRPLFRRKKPVSDDRSAMRWDDTITLNSVFSKSRVHSSTTRFSMSSEENIVHASQGYEMSEPRAIQVTREVTVTYQASDTPFVHAALVGLVQGEIANPRLVQR